MSRIPDRKSPQEKCRELLARRAGQALPQQAPTPLVRSHESYLDRKSPQENSREQRARQQAKTPSAATGTPQGEPENKPAAAPPRKRHRGVLGLQSEIPKKVPSRRDLQVYQLAVIRRRPQAEVAQQFHITPQRVRYLVRRVRLWKCTLPWQLDGLTDEQQINLATHETRDWLEEVRDQALDKLNDTTTTEERTVPSQGDQPAQPRTVSKRLLPKSGFLNVAMNAVSRWGRLGGAGEHWNLARIRATRRARFGKLGPPPIGPCGKKNFNRFCISGAKYKLGKSCKHKSKSQVVTARRGKSL